MMIVSSSESWEVCLIHWKVCWRLQGSLLDLSGKFAGGCCANKCVNIVRIKVMGPGPELDNNYFLFCYLLSLFKGLCYVTIHTNDDVSVGAISCSLQVQIHNWIVKHALYQDSPDPGGRECLLMAWLLTRADRPRLAGRGCSRLPAPVQAHWADLAPHTQDFPCSR